MNKNRLYYLAFGMIAIGVIILIYFIVITIIDGYWIWGGEKTDYEVTGQFGDFFGGVIGTFFALSGTFLIVLTFLQQSKHNQKENFKSKFYEMLRLHKENVNEIQIQDKKGRKAIEVFVKDLNTIYIIVEKAIEEIRNTNAFHTIGVNDCDELSKMKKKLNNDIDRKRLIHKLSYGYFFYGIDEYHITKKREDIIYAINSVVNTMIIRERLTLPEGSFPEFNSNYNSFLGHYFRHLYQMVKFVAKTENDLLPESEKYDYVKIIRAQLSDYEQILLYYNALSVMGEKWITPLGKKNKEEMGYIARFKLVKNIPYYFHYFGIKPGDLFQIEKESWEQNYKESFFEIELES